MIPIHNVYYMLAYAFKALNSQGYKDMQTETFENVADLCAAILCKGISLQIKRGLGRTYIEKSESLSALRGHINMPQSIKTQSLLKQQLICDFDDFSVNTPMNQIIKSTLILLLRSDVSKERKKAIRRLLVYFNDIDSQDIHTIDWHFQYNKQNETYRMLISICYLVVKGLLQTNEDGTTRMMDFFDEQRMHRLYERFILEYYRKEYLGQGITANASQIPWQLDDGTSDLLPIMQTDIMLTKGEKVLIIDAKYYSHSLQKQYDRYTVHSGNLYQIFTYVKNKEAELANRPHTVSGLLLYAKTNEDHYPDNEYSMSKNRIGVKALDLSGDFDSIKKQLDAIAVKYLS